MGYSTTFYGRFNLDRQLDKDTYELIQGLADTRRMARSPIKLAERLGISVEEVEKKYGDECHLWCGDTDDYGQEHTSDIISYNAPPRLQPGLWLQWIPTDDRMGIEWDGGEKFYNAQEWIKYLIKYILKPRGYVVNGIVDAEGEEHEDLWRIEIINNEVEFLAGHVIYE